MNFISDVLLKVSNFVCTFFAVHVKVTLKCLECEYLCFFTFLYFLLLLCFGQLLTFCIHVDNRNCSFELCQQQQQQQQ